MFKTTPKVNRSVKILRSNFPLMYKPSILQVQRSKRFLDRKLMTSFSHAIALRPPQKLVCFQ